MGHLIVPNDSVRNMICCHDGLMLFRVWMWAIQVVRINLCFRRNLRKIVFCVVLEGSNKKRSFRHYAQVSILHGNRRKKGCHQGRVWRRTMRRVLGSVVLVALLAVAGYGQTFRGAINGTVSDPSGAMVAGANVKATNLATSVTLSTTTTSDGQFSFQDLPLGTYRIAVSAGGFNAAGLLFDDDSKDARHVRPSTDANDCPASMSLGNGLPLAGKGPAE